MDRESDESFYSAMSAGDDTFGGLSGNGAHDLEEVSEELNVNWCMLALRVTSVVLIVAVIVSFALGRLDARLFVLGAIIFAIFTACFIGSFFNCFKKRFFVSSYTQGSFAEHGLGTKSLLFKDESQDDEKFLVV